MSVFIPITKKSHAKQCSNYRTAVLVSHASKVMLKILQGRLHKDMNEELPDLRAGFRKGRGTRDQNCQHPPFDHRKNKGILQNFCFIDYAKAFVWITTNCGKFLKRDGNTRPTYLSPVKPACRSRSNSQNQTLNNRLVPNWGSQVKGRYIEAIYCHPAYLAHMQSTS